MKPTLKPAKRIRPALIIVIGFLCVILAGSLLLSLPLATNTHEPAKYTTSLFTAVSATCVTGLVLEDTASYWSVFGQIVILVMIQIGGLGFMTMAVMLSLLIGRAISPRERMVIAQSLSLSDLSGTVKLVRRILMGTAFFEILGAASLMTQFIPLYGVKDGIYTSIFISVSAFCNAGFDIFGLKTGAFSSLTGFADNYTVSVTVMLLIIIGGIGFAVWNDLWLLLRKGRHISVYSRFVLTLTAILIFGGTLLIALFEWNNPQTIGNMAGDKKLLASFFQSVTTRTAGFNTIDNTSMRDVTKVLSILLMFIGGAAGSTAGGVKIGTVGLVMLTVLSVLRGTTKVVLFRRRTVSYENVMRAMALLLITAAVIITGALSICAIDGRTIMEALFETVSASSTVGLSLSLTPLLSAASQVILMVIMFFGRVGILTFSYAIIVRMNNYSEIIEYPETPFIM